VVRPSLFLRPEFATQRHNTIGSMSGGWRQLIADRDPARGVLLLGARRIGCAFAFQDALHLDAAALPVDVRDVERRG